MWTNITIIIINISLLFHILTRVFKPNFKSNFTKMYDTLYVVARPSRFKCHLNYLPSSQHCLFFSSSSCFLHHSSCFFIPRPHYTAESRDLCVCVCVSLSGQILCLLCTQQCVWGCVGVFSFRYVCLGVWRTTLLFQNLLQSCDVMFVIRVRWCWPCRLKKQWF